MNSTPLANPISHVSESWTSCTEALQTFNHGPQRSEAPGHAPDRVVTTSAGLLIEPEDFSGALWARAEGARPMTRLEQLTLEDLIEDALLLGVVSRVSCKGDRYEIMATGDRYTLSARQALAFLGGAVEVYRAQWRLNAAVAN